MDIYILRQDQETGPYSSEAARLLLAEEAVAATDFAWHDGLPDWIPLGDLLEADFLEADAETPDEPIASTASQSEPVAPSAAAGEPATPKQKALLSFLGIAQPGDLMRDRAALMVNDAIEDPANAARLTQWNEDRLRLHPDLFAAEIQAKRENRAAHFLELCHSTGAEYFTGVTKAHCQVLVGFLDLKFPHWDAREADAAAHYFFPAVAEKFPQLVHKAWRGRLHYSDSPHSTARSARISPTSKLRRTGTSAFVAVARGAILGCVILAGLYVAHRTIYPPGAVAAPPSETAAPPATPAPPAALPAAPSAAAAIAPTEVPVEPLPQITAASPAPSSPPPPRVVLPLPTPVAVAGTPTAAMDTPMAALPLSAPNAAMEQATPGMSSAAMTMEPTSLATAPMATLPGMQPASPTSAPVATMSSAPLPSGLPPEASALPPLTAADRAPAIPAVNSASAPNVNLVLTKPVEVQLAYGKVTLPPGTPVKLLERQGAGALKVSYGSSVMTVPSSSTDAD